MKDSKKGIEDDACDCHPSLPFLAYQAHPAKHRAKPGWRDQHGERDNPLGSCGYPMESGLEQRPY